MFFFLHVGTYPLKLRIYQVIFGGIIRHVQAYQKSFKILKIFHFLKLVGVHLGTPSLERCDENLGRGTLENLL